MAVTTKFDLLDSAHADPNRRGELSSEQRTFVGILTGVAGVTLVVRASMGVVALGIGAIAALVMLATRAPAVTFAVPAMFVAVGAALVWTSVRPLLWANQTRQDLSDGRVEKAPGEVVWRGGRYVARVGGRSLRYEPARSNLQPGAYTFYYLPRSGWVVGAEPAGPDARQARTEPASAAVGGRREVSGAFDLRSALAEANDFSLATLEANRSGRLGDGQGDGLIATAVRTLVGGVAFGGLGALIGVLLASKSDSPVPWLIVVAFVLAGAFMVYQATRLIADARGGRVEVTEGVGRRSLSRGKNSVSYYYHVEKLSFGVSRAAYDALLEDRPYRFYYTPRTKTLVSVEPVESH